jgi:hypothetical protein
MAGKGGATVGAGRKKGIPNKLTVKVKDAIKQAFDELGGVTYLVDLGRKDPKTFTTLLCKIIPAELSATLIGDPDNPIVVNDLSAVDRAARIADIFKTAMVEHEKEKKK